MSEQAHCHATPAGKHPLQRKTFPLVRSADDCFEREADRAADAVMKRQDFLSAGISLSQVPIASVQRDENGRAQTDQEKYKEAGKKLAEAFLETPMGKKLKDSALNDPLVKGAKDAGTTFISTLPGKIITGAAASGAVAALAATHQELPAQIPEIPLDILTPGLALKITYEGPVDNPTKAMITFSYKDQLGVTKKPAKTESERLREETARMAADQAKFRAGQKYAPGSQAAKQQAEEDARIERVATRGVGGLPGFNAPLLPPHASPGFQLQAPALHLAARKKPLRLLDQELQLKSAEELGLVPDPLKKKEEEEVEGAVQRQEVGSVAQPRSSPQVSEVTKSGGVQLDPATRADMEAHFRADFSDVRIHADQDAARAARSIDALAYTTGRHIVFSHGAYVPHALHGKRLLAHELAHVVQQTAAPSIVPTVQRKPQPAAPTTTQGKWYQEVLDKVLDAERRMDEVRKAGSYPFPPPYYDDYKSLLTLCEAVDSQPRVAVKKKLEDFSRNGFGLYVGMQLFSRELLTEMSARLYEMGLEAESAQLRAKYAAEDKFGPYNDDIYGARRKVDFYTRLVSGANKIGKPETPSALTTSMLQFARVFVALRDEFAAIDMVMVERDRANGSFYRGMRPGMSYLEFHESIRSQIWRWQEGLSVCIQRAMDLARSDLELPQPTGSGAALLKALRAALAGELHDVLFPKDEKLNIAGLSRETTKTTLDKGKGKGKGTITDFFPPDPAAPKRLVEINTYDPQQEFVRELHANLATFWKIRMEQLDVLGRIYGVLDILAPPRDFAEGMRIAAAATDNAQSIRNMSGGRLRLDSDDDWRIFLLQMYNDMVHPAAPVTQAGAAQVPAAKAATTPSEALHVIIPLLFNYLKAFTVHARFTNIYDADDTSYLNRPFPRALTGQLVHDCGVYALRVAYILSLVRKELGLRFRFVTLPVHVSLVITGEALPTFVIENDQFTEISVAEMMRILEQHNTYKDPATGAKPPGLADEEQFIGELAAQEFIRGPLDMPFKVTDVPPPVASARTEQIQLWTYYKKTAVLDVFGPSSQRKGEPNYLFHKNYLALTEEMRQLFNEYTVPFWNNAAPDAWDNFMKSVAFDRVKKTQRDKLPIEELETLLGEYHYDFSKALKPLRTRYTRLADDERRLSRILREDPKLAKAGVRLSVGARSFDRWQYYWDQHDAGIKKYVDDLALRKTGATENVDAVPRTLQPPFIPRDEKQFFPVD